LWTTRRAELEQFARQEENSYGNDGSPEESICRKPATRLESELADENALIRAEALARRLTARLERSGWIHFQNRSGQGEIMSFHPYAARIAETLLRVARDEQPVFEGLVHSIAALLDPRGVCSTSRRAFPSYRAYKNPSRQTDAVRAIPKLTSVDCPRLKRLAINRTDFTVLDGSQVAGNAQFQASEMRTQLAIAHRVQHVRANTITSLVPETVPEETVRVLFAPSDEAFIIIQKKPNTSCEFLFMTEHTPMLRGVAPATY